MTNNTLYLPYKVVGLVTDGSPFVVNKLGNETFITIPIGNMFQVFRADRLTPILVSKPAPGPIELIQAHDQDTFVVVNDTIYQYRRTKLIGAVGSHDQKINHIKLFGELIVSVDVENVVKVFRWKSRDCISVIKVLHQSTISVIMHPATYLNKMVFGFADGSIELWNIISRKLIYSFQKHLSHVNHHSSGKPGGVSTFCQSPACDVLAVGFDTGDLLMINLKLDQVIFKFRQKSKVTSITFRTDSQTNEYPFLVSSSDKGHMYTWAVYPDESDPELVISKLEHSLYSVHDGSITKLEFLHGEPVMLSNGTDNSIKMWIFDNPDGSPRLLRSRQGHKSYPKQIRYYGDVSAGAFYGTYLGSGSSGLITVDHCGDLMFSNIGKHCHFEKFSASNALKGGAKAFPPIIASDHTFITARSWGNLVTIHKNHGNAYVWKVEDRSVTTTVLKCIDVDIIGSGATAVIMSSCGNFSVVGYSTGALVLFNIQSGLSRGTFQFINVDDYPKNQAISGLFIDAANTVVVSARSDGHIVFHDFKTKQLLNSIFVNANIVKFVGCKESNLCAAADDKGFIRIVDIATGKTCRIFLNSHTQRVSDLLFSLDGRRVISSSLDSTVRVWDLLSGKCLSWLKFDSPVACISLTPSGDLLVGKIGHRGIDVCFDRSLTEPVAFSSEPKLPTEVHTCHNHAVSHHEDNGVDEIDEFVTNFKAHIHCGIELSSQPKSYWTSLCNMELLRKRSNVEQPAVKVATPFFLPNLMDAGRKANSLSKDNNGSKKTAMESMDPLALQSREGSRRLKFSPAANTFSRCSLARFLRPDSSKDIDAIKYLYSLAPAKVDQEIRLLCLHEQDIVGLRLLQGLLQMIFQNQHLLQNFDVIQSYVHRILTIHGSKLCASYDLRSTIDHAKHGTHIAVHQLQVLVYTALCILKTNLNIQLV